MMPTTSVDSERKGRASMLERFYVPEDMIALDRWMVDRALQLQNELDED